MSQRHGFRFFGQGQVQRSIEMHFEPPNTPNTSCIQKLPVIEQRRLFLNWELSLQGPDHTLKYLGIRLDGSIIAGEMDIDTPACQVGVGLPERSHLVGADQDMADSNSILEMLEVVEVTLEAASSGCFCQVMSLIDNDSKGPALQQGRFHG